MLSQQFIQEHDTMTDHLRQSSRARIDQLRPHPQQDSLFSDLVPGELDELAGDMRERGLQHPVEVLPDFTIIAGHQRVLAARQLRWIEIDVIIRHDLAEAGDLAVEHHLIADNLCRRQMGRLERARCASRLMELEAGGSLDGLSDSGQIKSLRAMREQVGRLLGIGEREVSRLLQVIETPLAVQQAYDRGQIGIADINRVARSPTQKKEMLSAAIRDGEPPKDALCRLYPPRHRRQLSVSDRGYLHRMALSFQKVRSAYHVWYPVAVS